MTRSQSMVLEDYPILRQSAPLALKALSQPEARAVPGSWAAVQRLRQSAGMVICDIRRSETDDLPLLRLAAQENLIEVDLLVMEVSPELHRAISHPAGPRALKVPGKIEKPVFLSTQERQLISEKHADATFITPRSDCTPNNAINQELSHQDPELLFQPKTNLAIGFKCNSDALMRGNHGEYEIHSPAYSRDRLEVHYLQFELTGFEPVRALYRHRRHRDDGIAAIAPRIRRQRGPGISNPRQFGHAIPQEKPSWIPSSPY